MLFFVRSLQLSSLPVDKMMTIKEEKSWLFIFWWSVCIYLPRHMKILRNGCYLYMEHGIHCTWVLFVMPGSVFSSAARRRLPLNIVLMSSPPSCTLSSSYCLLKSAIYCHITPRNEDPIIEEFRTPRKLKMIGIFLACAHLGVLWFFIQS